MRPCPSDSLPVMGEIPGVTGAYVSTGHNCWGILWAPVCGLAMAELIATGTCATVDLSSFNPGRFMKSEKNRGRKKGAVYVGEQW
jgi:glycine/D-amino acid oxidase-like deaminating enzyme